MDIAMPKVKTVLAALLVALLAAACGGGGSDAPPPELGAAPPKLSVVVLGDSIASGEGINYGYTYYYSTGIFPSEWYGGVVNPQWQGDYQLCHDSAQAYGDVLAPMIGATLTKFACTGSTYENGITFDRRYDGKLYRPAQFGNWLAMTNLNPAYDAANPDVVIITLGADDVSFADIFTYCNIGITDDAEAEALAKAPDRSRQLRAIYAKRFPTIDAWRNRAPRATSSYCTAENAGSTILKLFWDPINSGRIAGNYKNLVAAIKARGEKAGKVPRIIFTTYHQPLPGPTQSRKCDDLGFLADDEIDYLISLQNTLKETLIAAVSGIEGVSVADISGVVKGHEFCTEDPWTYGITVLAHNSESLAPFHPIPQGQAAIAAVLRQSFPER